MIKEYPDYLDELEMLIGTALGTLIGAGVGCIVNEMDCVSYLVEYFGGKAGSIDSLFEFSIPTMLGATGGFYQSFMSSVRRHKEAIELYLGSYVK